MGRHPRIEGKALIYFISSKGRNGQKIFRDDNDKIYFRSLLKKQKIKGKLIFYGYVLLPDLYACILETSKNNLIQSMHRINSDYANYFNRRHHCRNKLFHDRYNCFIIEKKQYLTEVSRYLHLLPVKERAVKLPMLYGWSSLPGYVSKNKQEDWINYNCILRILNENNLIASSDYKKYLSEGIKEKISSPFKNLKASNILGSDEFKKEIYQTKLSNKVSYQDDLTLAKKIIELVNQNSTWPSLKAKKKRIAKAVLSRSATIYFLKKFTELSNQQISRFFHSLKTSSISQMSRRFNLAKENYKSLKKISDSLESKIKAIAIDKNEKD